MAYRIAPSDVVAAPTVQGSGDGSMCSPSLTCQHGDYAKPQNIFCSRHYWSCVQVLILEDLQWLAWVCVRNVFPSCFDRKQAYSLFTSCDWIDTEHQSFQSTAALWAYGNLASKLTAAGAFRRNDEGPNLCV